MPFLQHEGRPVFVRGYAAALRAEIQSLASEIQRLRPQQQQLADVQKQLNALQQEQASASAFEQELAGEQTQGGRPAERPQLEPPNLRGSFDAEPLDDDGWASVMYAQLDAAFTDLNATKPDLAYDVRLQECRATLCLLEIGHADPTAQKRFQLEYMLRTREQFERMMIQPMSDGQGGYTTRILLDRTGDSRPRRQ